LFGASRVCGSVRGGGNCTGHEQPCPATNAAAEKRKTTLNIAFLFLVSGLILSVA
jgi:hypothetical protein